MDATAILNQDKWVQTEPVKEFANNLSQPKINVELRKPFGDVVMIAPSILQHSITPLFNRFTGRINSGGAKYLS